MEMGMGAEVTGTVPPKWGVPSDARHSALIEKLNITSFAGRRRHRQTDLRLAARPGVQRRRNRRRYPHGSLQGGGRQRRSAALPRGDTDVDPSLRHGWPVLRRQNTGFKPFNNDPVAGTQY